MERKRIGKWVLSVLLWFWTGGVYFFGEVIWKTSQGRPETISWTMFALAIILAVPLERFGAELPWGMPLVGQACICGLVWGCGITRTWPGTSWDKSARSLLCCGSSYPLWVLSYWTG